MHTKYIPTQAQWQKVIDNLYSVLPLILEQPNPLDMEQSRVFVIFNGDREHKCGTVHCLGGWYDIACKKERLFSQEQKAAMKPHAYFYEGFSEGATMLAADLGFGDHWDFVDWADDNFALWGNRRGNKVFVHLSAYQNAHKPNPKTFIDIIHHFELVKQNCAKYGKE